MLPGRKYTPEDLLSLAWKRKWVVALPFLVVALGTAVVSHYLPNKYYSETLIQVVPQRVPEAYVRSTITTKIEDRLQSMSQQIMSRTRLEKIIQEFNLYPRERQRGIMEDVVQQMRRDIAVDIARQADAFRLGYTAPDARVAMRVTERLATLFIDENLRDRGVLAEATSQFLENQLGDARRRLEEQEKKLEAFRKQYSGELPSQTESNMQAIHNTQMQIQALVESINRDRDRRLLLQRLHDDLAAEQALAAAAPVPAVVADPANPNAALQGATAAQQLEAARTQLQAMELRLKPTHPDIIRMKRVIRDLEKAAEEEALQKPLSPNATQSARPANPAAAQRVERIRQMEAEMESLDRQVSFKEGEEQRLRKQVSVYQARVEAVPGLESEWTALTRDYDTLQKAYQELLAKSEESKMAANLERRQIGEQFRVLDPANMPERPASPNRPQINLAGGAAGLALGLLLVAFLEYRDASFRTEGDVVTVLALPVLAMVPHVTTAIERQRARRRKLATSVAVLMVLALGAAGAVWRFELWKLVS